MLDLTARELEAGLWCIHTVSQGYGHEPPDGSVLDSLKRKLLDEAQPALGKGADIPGSRASVSRMSSWPSHEAFLRDSARAR